MAGSTITYPLNGAANWENFTDIVQKIQAGRYNLSFDNLHKLTEPKILNGSCGDLNGTMVVFSADEIIAGFSGIGNNNNIYLYISESAGSVSAAWSITAPTWSAAKRGWYNGNHRAIMRAYKDGSGNCTDKMIMEKEIYYTEKWTLSKNANYVIQDEDYNPIIKMTTGATDKTATLPTVADNVNMIVRLVKVDDGAGKAILDGEGAETINGTLTWEITEQWGYVEVISDGSEWIVLDQQGCIYEMWDDQNHTLTTSWVNKYSLAGISAGKYKIEYGATIYASATYGYMTIATSANVENDAKYTCLCCTSYDSVLAFISKSFMRTFTGLTTLYLNAKQQATDARIYNAIGGEGFIRAIRVG